MSLFCKTLGHKWDKEITGITHDGEPIGRCKRCDMPIVISDISIGKFMQQSYQIGLYVGEEYEQSELEELNFSRNEIKEQL